MSDGHLSSDAEAILLYLLTTRSTMERTKRAVRDACQMNDSTRAERALLQLFSEGFLLDLGDNTFELTGPGLQRARNLAPEGKPRTINTTIHQNIERVEGGNVRVTGVLNEQDIHATPARPVQMPVQTGSSLYAPTIETGEISKTLQRLRHELPTAHTHPLRTPIETQNGDKPKQPVIAVRFMLAFEILKDVLPIPVLSGDVLGRSPSANIYLRHDNYISSRHCRFEVRRDSLVPQHILYIEDLKSRNGTQVDDVYLDEGLYQLYHGSRIRIGNTVLVVIQIPY